MRTTFYILLAMLASATYTNLQAQKLNPATDTVEWVYTRIENKVLNENVALGGKFVSYGGKSFKWIQNGVDREYTFENKSTTGDWFDSSLDGQFIYRSSCKDIDGTIRIYRDRRKVFIVLDFVQPDKRTPHLVFEITSYSKL
jgi:hypothetical protein